MDKQLNSGVVLRLVVAVALVAGASARAFGAVTYTVDRIVPPGRISGTIQTNGNLGVLTAADILDWNLTLDADGNPATTGQLLGPLSGGNSTLWISGIALTATPTGLFWDFSAAGFNIFQIIKPDSSVAWQLQAFFPMSDEQVRESLGVQTQPPRTGLDQIATGVTAPLEITTDTTLVADRRGGIVIAADNVTLDCAHHRVEGNGGSGIGIHVAGRTGVTITGCVVVGFGEGIVLEDSSHITLSENTVGLSVNGGIRLSSAHRNRLTGNDISDSSSPSHVASGLVIASSSNNRVEFNSVTASDVTGILVSDGSASNEFVANVSSHNGGRGFDIVGASSNSFWRNTVIGNRDGGFVVRDGAKRNRLLENSACFNRPSDATEERDGRRSNGNVWVQNLFCAQGF